MGQRLLRSVLVGALCAALPAAVTFLAGALLDGTSFAEAAAFAMIVGLGGALLGGFVGAITAVTRAGYLGGAFAGLLVTLAVVAFYVLTSARPGQAGYFLRESAVFVAVLALPLVLAGLATVWLNKRAARP